MSVIQVVGTSYKQCSIEERERFSAVGRPLSELLAEAQEVLQARECVLLRTCNRVELYFLGPQADLATARSLLCGAGDAAAGDSLYQASGMEAADHLFAVAAGLNSMVLGEHEIVGQVREAAAAARAAGFAGPILSRLFDHALRTGRRARRETAISSGIFSLGQCAARTAHDLLGCLRGKRVLVFGAGRMAKVAAQHLVATGAGPLSIFSRTYARAEELARALGGRAISAEEVPAALRCCDVLVGCTTAPHHVVTAGQLREAVLDREARPLVVIDLGVPRNVDPAAGALPGVHLHNVDQLECVVATHVGEREREIARVRGIVGEEVGAFQQWVEGTRVSALITQLRARAEEARQACLEVAERQFSGEDLAAVDYALDLLVRKLLHTPIAAIREAATESEADPDLVAAARRLFGLAAEEPGPSAVPAEPAGQRGGGSVPLAR
jgi:glutamyl-tRNA reductase